MRKFGHVGLLHAHYRLVLRDGWHYKRAEVYIQGRVRLHEVACCTARVNLVVVLAHAAQTVRIDVQVGIRIELILFVRESLVLKLQVDVDLEHLLDVKANEIVELLIITAEKHAHWGSPLLFLLYLGQEVSERVKLETWIVRVRRVANSLGLRGATTLRVHDLLLAKDELEVWDVILQLVLLVFPIRLDCDWNLDDFVLQRKEYFLADVSLNDVVGHVYSLD